jgi:hypothetical protein
VKIVVAARGLYQRASPHAPVSQDSIGAVFTETKSPAEKLSPRRIWLNAAARFGFEDELA